jgi:acetyl esterase
MSDLAGDPHAAMDPDMAAAFRLENERAAALPPARDLEEERAHGRASAHWWNEGLPELPSTEDHELRGPRGPVAVRLFRGSTDPQAPVLLYVHGGGWVVGSVVQNEPLIRTLASSSGWTVAAVTYRLAPEHPYPAGLEDILTVADWLDERGHRFALSGTSAGGNLAMAAALARRARGRPAPLGLLLFYGVFGADLDTPSYRRFGDGRFGLSRDRMAAFLDLYDPAGARRHDPLITPLLADLAGLPPIWLLGTGLDVLRDDTLALHGRLIAAGVPTSLRFEPRVVHGFINRGRMVGAARRSLVAAAHFLSELAGS